MALALLSTFMRGVVADLLDRYLGNFGLKEQYIPSSRHQGENGTIEVRFDEK